MICDKCGKKLDDDAQFCKFCGAKLENLDLNTTKKSGQYWS